MKPATEPYRCPETEDAVRQLLEVEREQGALQCQAKEILAAADSRIKALTCKELGEDDAARLAALLEAVPTILESMIQAVIRRQHSAPPGVLDAALAKL